MVRAMRKARGRPPAPRQRRHVQVVSRRPARRDAKVSPRYQPWRPPSGKMRGAAAARLLDPAAKLPGTPSATPTPWTHWGNEAKFGMSFADRWSLQRRL